MQKIRLGCDPEIFLANRDGKLIASCGKIGGSKAHPQPLPDLGDGFAIQEDNVAIEFNIPPSSDRREFTHNIMRAVKYIGDNVHQHLDLRLELDLSAASYDDDQLEAPAAKEFGCDPDYNAWTGRKNPRPKADDPNLRSCGGHVHVGYNKKLIAPEYLIRVMDLFLGVPSVLMDKGELRKKLYGKAGAFREKDYGVEYRTMSNFWIKDPKLTDWVWNSTERAVAAADAEFPVGKYRAKILDAIDNNNKEAALQLVQECKLEVLSV